MSTPDDELGDARPRVSHRAKAWGWAGVALLVVIASVFGWQAAQQPVRWKDVGFSIDSPTSVTATFDVYIYKETDAVCHLRALNKSYAEVGVTDVRVRFADGAQQRITAPIVTTEVATTAVVKYCEPVD